MFLRGGAVVLAMPGQRKVKPHALKLIKRLQAHVCALSPRCERLSRAQTLGRLDGRCLLWCRLMHMKWGQIVVIKKNSFTQEITPWEAISSKGLLLWRFVRDYDRKACINKAMWEEKENGSDNALCHSYYTSQLLRPMRTLQVCRDRLPEWERRTSPTAGLLTCHPGFPRRYLNPVDIAAPCLQFHLCWGHVGSTQSRGGRRRWRKRDGDKQVEEKWEYANQITWQTQQLGD